MTATSSTTDDGPVRERLGRGVDQDPSTGLGGVGGGGDAATNDTGGDREGGRDVAHGARRQHGPGRDSNERVQRVPAGIDARDLVRKELHAIHRPGGENHQWIAHQREVFRQLHVTGVAGNAEHGNGGVQVDATGPGDAHGQGKGLYERLILVHGSNLPFGAERKLNDTMPQDSLLWGCVTEFTPSVVQAWLDAGDVQAQVLTVEHEFVGQFSNAIHRINVQTDPPNVFSRALIVKSPRPGRRDRDPGFGRELRFYSQLSSRVPVHVPRFVFGDADAQLLVLEETGYREISFRGGATPEHLEVAVDAMARLHRWGLQRSLPGWLVPTSLPLAQAWRAGREGLGGLVPEFVAVGDALADQLPAGPQATTLVHGDAHLENLPLLPDARDVLFLDWADVCAAPPSHDLAFFVVMSLPIEKRRCVERELIARHADAVGDVGAGPVAAYRWGVLIRAARIVAIALVRPVEEMLASAGLRLVAKRSLTAAADWF